MPGPSPAQPCPSCGKDCTGALFECPHCGADAPSTAKFKINPNALDIEEHERIHAQSKADARHRLLIGGLIVGALILFTAIAGLFGGRDGLVAGIRVALSGTVIYAIVLVIRKRR